MSKDVTLLAKYTDDEMQMKAERFIYNLNYPSYEKESCEIEVRSLFKFDLKEKVFLKAEKFILP